MIIATQALQNWFRRNQIPTDGLTVTLDFHDADAAIRFEAALVRELEALQTGRAPVKMEIDSFTMNGLKIRVESPLRGWRKP